MRAILASVSLASALLACASASGPNVMQLPAVCNTVPPPLRPGELDAPVVPRAGSAPTDSGVVVGTITEAGSGRVLHGASVVLLRSTPDARRIGVGPEVPADAQGGFVLGPAAPGTYTVRVRSIAHRLVEQPVVVGAGATDTLHVRMHYHQCVGY